MAARLLKIGAGIAAASAGVSLLPTSVQGKSKPDWAAAERAKQESAAAKSAADGAKAAADAAKAKAAADLETARIRAQSDAAMAKLQAEAAERAASVERQRLQNEAERAERDRQERERRSAEERAKQEADSSWQKTQSYLMPAVSVGVAAVAAVVGAKVGGKLGARAASSAADAAASLVALGKKAAQINKASGVLSAKPAGDAMKAIVSQAGKVQATASATPVPIKVGNALTAATTLQGAAMGVGSMFVDDPAVKNAMRIEAAASIGGALGLKGALAVAKGSLPKGAVLPSSIVAGANRLAREASGGAAKISKARVGTEVAKARAVEKVTANRGMVAVAQAEKAVKAARGALKAKKPSSPPPRPAASSRPTSRRGTGSPRNRAGYKDTWTDKNGRTYVRRDKSVRVGR